ncbi:MAG TPA: metalloregulator ArsR/SmtB family transcription factor [Candidatus Binataceae bacterium]|nr:metalloregulator ArsR/SmtB family transcription factor [Candidatus Binataceae bacterium]
MPLDRTIAALGDPTRRAILRRLADAPRRAGELAAGFAISRPAVCKHTRLLTQAGLIRARKNGRERIYELAPSGGKAMREAIEHLREMERFWDLALDAFKHHAEKDSSGSQETFRRDTKWVRSAAQAPRGGAQRSRGES